MKRILLTLLGCLGFCCLADLQAQSYVVNGNASSLGNDCFRLTPNALSQAGAVWYNGQINLNQAFDVYVDVFFGCNDAGADGLAFVLQPNSTSIGSGGGAIGYGGIPHSLAIEFDTWHNDGSGGNHSPDLGDPLYDHLAIQIQGDLNHNGVNNLYGPVGIRSNLANVEDCQWHDLRITWDPQTQRIRVYVDCQLRINTVVGNIIQNVFNGDNTVYWGFTSGTGAASNLHQFCLDYISFTEDMSNRSICQGGSTQLDAGSGIGYAWSPAAGLSNPSIANPIASPSTTTTYTVTVTDECGTISRTDQVTVYVYQPVSLSLGPDVHVCTDEVVSITANHTNGTYFNWSTGEHTPSIQADQPGTYSVNVGNPGCGYVSDEINISWEPKLSFVLPATQRICEGDSLRLNATDAVGSAYLWSTGDTTPTIWVQAAGWYWAEVSNPFCPSRRDSFFLYLEPPISFSLGPDTTICYGDTFHIDASHPRASAYAWNTGDTSAQLFLTEAGRYVVELSNLYCPIVRDTLELFTEEPMAIELGADTLLCEGDVLLLDAFSPTATEYFWSTGDRLPLLGIQESGQYTVRLEARYCPSVSDQIEVRYEQPVQIELGPDTVLCAGESLELDATHPWARYYFWNTGETSARLTPTQSGLYLATAGNLACPEASDSVRLIFSRPVAAFDYAPDPQLEEVVVGEPIQFRSLSLESDRYHWQIPALDWESSEENPRFSFPESGEQLISLLVTDRYGQCQDSIHTSLLIRQPGVWLPTAFSPNGDGINDQLLIRGFGIKHMQTQIFTRWGKTVFHTESPQEYWQGRSPQGQAVPEGVYVVVVEGSYRSGKRFQTRGSVTLIR